MGKSQNMDLLEKMFSLLNEFLESKCLFVELLFFKNFFTLFFLLRIGEAVQYKIKWQGYDRPEDVTWEDKKSCHCPDLIAQFEDDNRMNAKKITQIPGGTRIELIEASNDISESTSTIIVSSLCAELTKVI